MTSIRSYFSGSKASDSDRIILAPSPISPRRNDIADDTLIEPDEFKLNGKQYVRCCVLAKPQKHNKKGTSIVWVYGEDIQLWKDATKKFWYCYLCEQQHRNRSFRFLEQGNTTALDHLESKHQIDRKTGDLKSTKKDPSQPSIIDFNTISTLVFKRRFDEFKELLIRWIVYCHIAFFQIENGYCLDIPTVDYYDEVISNDVILLGDDEEFDPIQYWNVRYYSQRTWPIWPLTRYPYLPCRMIANVYSARPSSFLPIVVRDSIWT